ncbi:olfactory receptor 10C1-like [Eublepharis macularius]|uniref:Olfactory receptor n=1 Tax=Eublepharis macularius TaxID=481883 RepID=A0AA97LAF4_EUBMA|nr:olfactory receptor 10C1-like [Eublepharis macularius]
MENKTSVSEFIILGFLSIPEMKYLLFVLFFCLYVLTVLSNVLIVVIISVDDALQSPMYFFLRNLSFLELCFTSVTIPNMLVNLILEGSKISFVGCATQLYFFLLLGVTECLLLTVMSYDRYVAICIPLRYTAIMSKRICIQCSAACWAVGFVVAAGHTAVIFSLPYCGPNIINHFFCDIQPLLMLVCGDTYWNEIQVIVVAGVVLMLPFILVLVSYVHIITSILNMSSARNRRKAFSTCSSHLTVVCLYYGTAVFMYTRPKSSYSLDKDKWFTLFYCVLTPLLNPIIYSLRNKEVKGALWKLASRIFWMQGR